MENINPVQVLNLVVELQARILQLAPLIQPVELTPQMGVPSIWYHHLQGELAYYRNSIPENVSLDRIHLYAGRMVEFALVFSLIEGAVFEVSYPAGSYASILTQFRDIVECAGELGEILNHE